MYKVIKHTIEEHHYNHPVLAEQAMADQPAVHSVVNKNKYVKPPKAPNVMTSAELKAVLQNYFDTFNTNLLSVLGYILTNDSENAAKAEETLWTQIDGIGEFAKSYYGVEFGERLNYGFRTVVIMMFNIARNIKNNYDTKDPSDRLNFQVSSDISNLLNTYNNLWRIGDVRTVLTQMFDGFKDFIKAKNDKNSSGETAAKEKLATGTSSFINAFATGLTQQFPGYFTA